MEAGPKRAGLAIDLNPAAPPKGDEPASAVTAPGRLSGSEVEAGDQAALHRHLAILAAGG